jgi:hypothetical protein
VNVCWFVSLLLSLVAALFGIFLKQWIRTYIKWAEVTLERDAVALRQHRYIGWEAWNIGLVLTVLPVLLQIAVILFLIGLLVFLWNLNQVVASVMLALGGGFFHHSYRGERRSYLLCTVPVQVTIVNNPCLSELAYLLLPASCPRSRNGDSQDSGACSYEH